MYFPDDGMLSVTIGSPEGRIVEIAMIRAGGRLDLAGGLHRGGPGLWVVVQVAGCGHQMPLSQYRRLSSEHTTFRELNGPYSHQVLVAMIAQSALCLATHAVEERLARWLLTTAGPRRGRNVPPDAGASRADARRPASHGQRGRFRAAGTPDHQLYPGTNHDP